MDKLPQISEAEYEIMKILWESHPLSTNEIWNQKTIHTLLSRLTAKKAVSYEQRGRMYYYTPLIARDAYLEQENSHFLNRFYDGKMAPMLSSLLSNTRLSDSELQDLYDMIHSKMNKGEKL